MLAIKSQCLGNFFTNADLGLAAVGFVSAFPVTIARRHVEPISPRAQYLQPAIGKLTIIRSLSRPATGFNRQWSFHLLPLSLRQFISLRQDRLACIHSISEVNDKLSVESPYCSIRWKSATCETI
jgi:hypothetical protein